MKSIVTQLVVFTRNRPTRRNVKILLRFFGTLVAMVVLYSIVFHYIMAYEGRDHSWVTGFYWTLTVMSTLGFGDITFNSDLGRAFSILVLVSGTLFLLVLLPFTFIQFFYAPWMEARNEARAPRQLPETTAGHLVLAHHDSITESLVARCNRYGHPYVVLEEHLDDALRLHDQGMRVMVGSPTSAETLRAARVDSAALVVATGRANFNATVSLLTRATAPDVPMIVTSDGAEEAEILKLAGAKQVITLSELTGESLARRTIGGDAITHVIGGIDELLVAEANASRTPLVGKTIAENRLSDIGVSILGVSNRGKFELARPESMIEQHSVLVLAGSREQLDGYDEAFVIYNVSSLPALVIGAGRVGRATCRALIERGIDFRVVENDPAAARHMAERFGEDKVVVGNATQADVLKKAGLDEAPAVLLTSHDDTLNVYLTILLRHLRPDVQLLSRTTLEQSVATLHEAGADVVLSTASLGSSMILNLLERTSILPIAEGLNVIRMATPPGLVQRSLVEVSVRAETGATIIALVANGQMHVNPDPNEPLPAESEILLIGTDETERKFMELYHG
ncbi:MAG: NAD-binding protein [Planctomycetota bacterium]